MDMHIGCCREDKQAKAVYHPVCRDTGPDMADRTVPDADVGHPPVRKTDVLQGEGGR
jgi:hypothetical protein